MQKFDNIVGDKLRDVEIQPSARLYSRIEATLAEMEHPVAETKRARIIPLWSYAAAAAVVAVAILFAVRQTNNATLLPNQNQGIVAKATMASVVPALPPQQKVTTARSISEIILSTAQNSSTQTLYASVEPNDMAPVTASDVEARAREALNNPPKRNRTTATTNWWDEVEDYDDDYNFIERTIRNSSASVYGGNFGLLNGDMVSSNSSLGGRMAAPDRKGASSFGDSSLSFADQVVDNSLIHRMPISVGLSVSIPIMHELSLTGGLNYSYLESVSKASRALANNESRTVRELHYVGVTGALTYFPYQSRYWSLYMSGSATLEKAVYARQTETSKSESGVVQEQHEQLNVKGVQPSLGAAAGVMFNITPWMGLYVEPGVAYYFNTGQPTNYRTENPISFSLQVGLRFNWK